MDPFAVFFAAEWSSHLLIWPEFVSARLVILNGPRGHHRLQGSSIHRLPQGSMPIVTAKDADALHMSQKPQHYSQLSTQPSICFGTVTTLPEWSSLTH
jgi:hypothetical protein